VNRLAVLPGPFEGLVEQAARRGAQAVAAGEMEPREIEAARAFGLGLVTIGRVDSLRPLVPAVAGVLLEACARNGWDMKVEGYRDQGGRWG
jgi:putative NIF3 family GTP cyclohydrolase 1 type 2